MVALHVAVGSAAIGSGAVALAARKGGRLHRLAGNAFVGAMLLTLLILVQAAPIMRQPINLFGGAFGLYLVISGWAAARRPDGKLGRFGVCAMLALATAVPMLLAFGWLAAHAPGGKIQGVPYAVAYVLAGVAAFAGALDVSVFLRGGVSGAQRVARHLWRMGLALYFASAALFVNQPQVFPAPLRGSPLLAALAYAPLMVMLFWLLRVQFTDAFRPTATPAE